MYTVTFYSFKGGVGRTMALVNMATQLAMNGKRVLIVDFDLEAPGIPTFSLTAPKNESKGLVEYICAYREFAEAPDVNDYIYSAHTFEGGGELLVMPAGLHDSSYSARLNSIEWAKLYEEEEGFLFFEDLRNQWKNSFNPDYVLIDSRTGHSDVEGICTRQLPDAVCLLFFPNDQNLQGLTRVASNIRTQNQTTKDRHDEILMHFVVSNVPDLDDEDGIIRQVLDKFKSNLGYPDVAAKIHHYNSLSLLGQEIFVANRPNSRLAKEYINLTNAITKENLSDKDVALSYLRKTARELRSKDTSSVTSVITRIERALKLFPLDYDVTIEVAQMYEAMGRVGDALALMPADFSEGDAQYFALRARLNDRLSRKDDTLADIDKMLDSEGAEAFTLLQALFLANQHFPEVLSRLSKSKAFNSLPTNAKEFVVVQMEGGRETLLAKAEILESLLQAGPEEYLQHELGMVNIGLGKFDESIRLLTNIQAPEEDSGIEQSFNLAMAKLGRDGVADRVLFERVLMLAEKDERRNLDANFLACLAISNHAIGNSAAALDFIEKTNAFLRSRPRREFSPWSYSKVSPAEFLRHMKSLELQIKTGELCPEFCKSC